MAWENAVAKMIRALSTTLGFLTVFKINLDPPPDMTEVGRSSWAFPLVGALLGMLLLIAQWFFAAHFPSIVAAILTVGLWVFLTGGLHLDGWTDCWDALAAAVSPERRLEILKDSRLGTFGTLALVLLLGLKVAAIGQPGFPLTMLFVAPIIGRAMMVLAAHGARCRGSGMGAMFFAGLDATTVGWAAIFGFTAALLGGWSGLIALGAAYVGTIWFRRLAEHRLGLVNGDVLGGVCELSEVIVVVVATFRM
jgi:adenosylcobinamide-GDP ribazoletransferase